MSVSLRSRGARSGEPPSSASSAPSSSACSALRTMRVPSGSTPASAMTEPGGTCACAFDHVCCEQSSSSSSHGTRSAARRADAVRQYASIARVRRRSWSVVNLVGREKSTVRSQRGRRPAAVVALGGPALLAGGSHQRGDAIGVDGRAHDHCGRRGLDRLEARPRATLDAPLADALDDLVDGVGDDDLRAGRQDDDGVGVRLDRGDEVRVDPDGLAVGAEAVELDHGGARLGSNAVDFGMAERRSAGPPPAPRLCRLVRAGRRRAYRLMLTRSLSISSAVEMTRELAWKPRCALIMSVNSVARSTFDISSVPPMV